MEPLNYFKDKLFDLLNETMKLTSMISKRMTEKYIFNSS